MLNPNWLSGLVRLVEADRIYACKCKQKALSREVRVNHD